MGKLSRSRLDLYWHLISGHLTDLVKLVNLRIFRSPSMLYFFLILATPLLLPLYCLIIFCNWMACGSLSYFGISANAEVEGIRLSNHAKTTNRLLAWKDISEVNEVFKPPCFTLEFLLKFGELVTISFGIIDDMELVLKDRGISFRKIN